MLGDKKDLDAPLRSGSLGLRQEDPGKFPFEAFEHELPSGATPTLRLKSPWKLDIASGNLTSVKLDDLAAPDDNTNLNASTSKHGLLKKLDNSAFHFLDGKGNWSTISHANLRAPVVGEPSGGTWHKVADPPTGWMGSKTSGWTVDSFSGGYSVDFTGTVPVGTQAVRVVCLVNGTGSIAWRKGGDTNVANTPFASGENSNSGNGSGADRCSLVLWLAADNTVQFAVSADTVDLYVSYPIEYML